MHFALSIRRCEAILLLLLAAIGFQADAQEVFARNLEQVAFVPKGQWIGGCSISYTTSNQKNYQFFIIENITGDTYSFKVSPMVFYSFKDNLAIGGRFSYNRSKTKFNSADVIIDSETSYSIDHLYSLSQTYTGAVAFRNYISFGRSKRFGVFNEIQVQVSGGESKLVNGSGKDLSGTFERTIWFDIGLTPGLIMFLNNYSALEVSIGVLGFNYSNTTSTTDQIYIAHRKSKYANFRINLFSISFGVAFYI